MTTSAVEQLAALDPERWSYLYLKRSVGASVWIMHRQTTHECCCDGDTKEEAAQKALDFTRQNMYLTIEERADKWRYKG